MSRRAAAATTGAAAVLLALTGCSVPSHGWVGLLAGEDGSVSAIVQMCDATIDGVTVYTGELSKTETVAKVEFESPTTQAVSTISSVQALDTAVVHHIYGWTESDTSSARGPDFTGRDVLRLEPGQVWANDLDTSGYPARVFTPDLFRDTVLAHCDD